MRLIEIVTGPDTDTAVAARSISSIESWASASCRRGHAGLHRQSHRHLLAGRRDQCRDGPGLTVRKPTRSAASRWGAKTGIFGLVDLVGVDLMPLLTKSLSSTLPAGDAYFDTVRPMPLVDRMIAEGFTGRKGKGGFYAFDKATKTKKALDLATGEYRVSVKPASCRAGPRRIWLH
jgi:3-hydroxyacyl-CoA dehydrogenase